MTKYKPNKYVKKGQLGSLSTFSKSIKCLYRFVQVTKSGDDEQFSFCPKSFNCLKLLAKT